MSSNSTFPFDFNNVSSWNDAVCRALFPRDRSPVNDMGSVWCWNYFTIVMSWTENQFSIIFHTNAIFVSHKWDSTVRENTTRNCDMLSVGSTESLGHWDTTVIGVCKLTVDSFLTKFTLCQRYKIKSLTKVNAWKFRVANIAKNEPFPDRKQRLTKLYLKLISLFSLMTSDDGTEAPLCSNNHKISHNKLIQVLTVIVLSFILVAVWRNMA